MKKIFIDLKEKNYSKQASIRKFSGLILLAVFALMTACQPDARSFFNLPSYGFIDPAFLRGLATVIAILRIVLAIVGVVLLVAGFAIYEILVQVTGFIAGGIVGAIAFPLLGHSTEGWLALLGFIVGGLIGAGLALFLTYLGLFLIGMVIGGALAAGIWVSIFQSEPSGFLIIAGAIIGGSAIIVLYRFWITAFTAAVGAVFLGSAIGVGPGWWFLFFLIGMAIQYGLATALGRQDETKPGIHEPASRTKLPWKVRPADTDIEKQATEPPPLPGDSATEASNLIPQPPSIPEAFFIKPDGSRIPLHDNILIGRSSECDLCLTNKLISRKHARIRCGNDKWFIQDQNSAHGTFVNGQRVTATNLQHDDKVGMGEILLTFKLE